MEVINAIQKQVDAASPILAKILFMKPVPERSYLNPSGQTSGKKRYDKIEVKLLEEEIDKWQHSTRAVLAACFPGENEHKFAFERTIVSSRVFFDAQEELEKEVKEGRKVLSAIIEEVSLKMKQHPETVAKKAKEKTDKRPLVFISHCSKQKSFVKALVELFESCGFKEHNLFCSSVAGFNINEGDDIVDTLMKKFKDYNLYVIYVLSSDFFDSPYCMNEVGAAWVLQVANSIIETMELEDSKIDGVISKTKNRISFRNDDDDILFDKMIELRNKILDFTGLGEVSESNWKRYYDTFLDKIHKVIVAKTGKETSQLPPLQFPIQTKA